MNKDIASSPNNILYYTLPKIVVSTVMINILLGATLRLLGMQSAQVGRVIYLHNQKY